MPPACWTPRLNISSPPGPLQGHRPPDRALPDQAQHEREGGAAGDAGEHALFSSRRNTQSSRWSSGWVYGRH